MTRTQGRHMLTLQFIPHADIERLESDKRVEKLLKVVKENKIILLEGKLRSQEEAMLIKRTMEEIDESFTGIEISPINIHRKEDEAFFRKVKGMLINLLLGDRQGLTIIGPATVVKEIKQDPDKIQLFTEEKAKRQKK